jgi:GNAT superfamily N-acetyltransferase
VDSLEIRDVPVEEPDAKGLIDELSDFLERVTGRSGRASFDASDVEGPRAAFVVAYDARGPVGCGGIRPLGDDVAEVKRVYSRRRGEGVGGRVLVALEARARAFGYGRLVVETGRSNAGAVRFYLAHGYIEREGYGRYRGRPESVCFEKELLVRGSSTP